MTEKSTHNRRHTPASIFDEYEKGIQYKSSIGSRGLYEQSKINERFYVGDQWYGAKCGKDRPLVRHNVVKRIGEYKLSVIGAADLAVNYSAEGVPVTLDTKGTVQQIRENVAAGGAFPPETKLPETQEVNVVMSALSDYFRVTAERVKFNMLKDDLLKKAYQSGTGVLYTYWDTDVRTGLYADRDRESPIKGDISCDVIDIENVYFGDPSIADVQRQPYILIAQKKSVKALREEARKNGVNEKEISLIAADDDMHYAGDRSELKVDHKTATVITRLFKNSEGKIKGVRAVRGTIIRDEWDLKLTQYPLAVFQWERRNSCIYGDSEITYLIPNQIAINRMLTASVWSIMMTGMPVMLVDDDRVTCNVSNDPGQIIRISDSGGDIASAIRYVNPPTFSPQIEQVMSSMIANTLTHSGANDAALGNVRPDNTSAIIAVREAATMPLQIVQSRFYGFVEDVARIWADFWLNLYGERSLKVRDVNGTWYLPFKPDRYRDLLISAKVDVGASMLWSEAQSIQTLDNLFGRGVIDVMQYLERLPAGAVPNLSGLIREIEQADAKTQTASSEAATTADVETAVVDGLSPEQREKFDALPPEVQKQLFSSAGVGLAEQGGEKA